MTSRAERSTECDRAGVEQPDERAGNQPADHHAALVPMSRIDLARSIDWYSSTEAARLRRAADPVVRLKILAGAGRASAADRLAVTFGAG